MRYGASDVGSNSCRLLIGSIEDGRLKVLEKRVETTRLGAGLESTGWIKPEAMERTLFVLSQFLDIMRRYQVVEKAMVATSAVREAVNQKDFLFLAKERINLDIEVLNGEQEGSLSYLGAKKGLGMKANPILVDVGGGSTEFAFHRRQTQVISLPLGAVRATEEDWDEETIRLKMGKIDSTFGNFRVPLVLVGGTATTLVAIKKGKYDPALVQGEELTLPEINYIYSRLNSLTLEEKQAIPGLQPERADIIVKGILIIKCIMEILNRKQAIVSDSDLLDGIIWKLHEERTG